MNMQFQHHPDSQIYITVNDKKYTDTLDNFLKDYPSYVGLPAGYIERIYNPEKKISFIGTGSSQIAKEAMWAEGEDIFSKIDSLLSKQNTRNRPVKTLSELKVEKLLEVNGKTKANIVGGFISTATRVEVTFDSDEATQSTMQTMYVATKSSDFANHPDYQGVIPVRGFAEGSTVKSVFYLTATQVQKFMDDLALHIGKCKQDGWAKQLLVDQASTVEELEQIVL